jgi:hypothetical protein
MRRHARAAGACCRRAPCAALGFALKLRLARLHARLVDQEDLMTVRIIGAAAALATLLLATSVSAQTAATPGASPGVAPAQSESATPARRSRKSKAAKGEKKEPTVGQMAARERQRKCAAEWKTAKAGGKVADGMKWPKFWSQCNTRLKGNNA